jgi:hypothetical protein
MLHFLRQRDTYFLSFLVFTVSILPTISHNIQHDEIDDNRGDSGERKRCS